MVERVAAALFVALNQKPDGFASDIDITDDRPLSYVQVDGKYDLNEIARAAITAMREPTEGMIVSGVPVWHSMIDAALAEGTEAARR